MAKTTNIFDKLPFQQAIDALRERLAIPKPEFLKLDAANRSRAFTMARINDLQLLENIHDELSIAINNGETWPSFAKRLEELQERSGWTGTSPWHHRLVYDQNLGMAYSAGRVQQGRAVGLRVIRYLPSIAANPRPEHEPYYNQLYRLAPGSPVPPIDFGCNCSWEWVFEDELEALGIDPETLPVFDPPVPKSGFTWSATDYFNLTQTVAASERFRGMWDELGIELVAAAAREAVPEAVQSWFQPALEAASKLSRRQIERLIGWARAIGDLHEIEARWWHALDAIADDQAVELNHQVTLAALLAGMDEVGRINRR